MKELTNYFLKDPIDDMAIKKIAFQYFSNNLDQAKEFICLLQSAKDDSLIQKSLF